ncbi:response regulator [Streptomyces sp. GS7]|uniref:response regulator n=1 Tax=Streptomyces sp. GS7 TaxID=2692234 RepID=UPI0013169A28|nr:response regulator transcription factor [Streptomyces sp. GS7]QHC25641.1 response regulator [Streptomyces sp. GS7]
MTVRVVVADDQAVVREGLMTLLDMVPGIDVVGGAANGEEAIARAAELHPDAVLMDLVMPVLDGVEATRRITADLPDVAVVVLTTLADEAKIIDALQAGALGYLTKDAGKAEIARAIQAAVSRQVTLDPEVQRQLLTAAVRGRQAGESTPRRTPPFAAQLTPREEDVLRLLATGLSNAAIGRRLLIGQATVKTHVNHLFGKLGVTTRAEAVAWAHSHGYAPGNTV